MICEQLVVGRLVDLAEVGQRDGVADAGDHVLALGVLQVVAVLALAPDAGSRVKPTPDPEARPRLPKTIAWMLTAVPRSSGICSWRRYSTARSVFHESNTACTARSICSRGSWGNGRPAWSSIALVRRHELAQVVDPEVGVLGGAAALLELSSSWENTSPSMPSTVEPNICNSRR